jgi:hypothetical protein
MHTSDLAVSRALELHASLVGALQELEEAQERDRAGRLELLRQFRDAQVRHNSSLVASLSLNDRGEGSVADASGDGGLDLNDPILRYDYTHVTVGCTASK